MTEEEYFARRSHSLNHFHEKLFKLEGMMNTAAAKRIAARRTALMRSFVASFLQEWGGTDLKKNFRE